MFDFYPWDHARLKTYKEWMVNEIKQAFLKNKDGDQNEI